MSAFRLVLLLLLLCAGGAHAQFADNRASASLLQGSSNQADFLPVHQAFKPGVLDASADALALIVDIAPGYYLYRHRLQVSTDDGSVLQMQLPEGIHKTDEYFGDVEVYYNQLQIQLDPATLPAGTRSLSLGFQGCADAGLCYPPETVTLQLPSAPGSSASVAPAAPTAPSTSSTPASERGWLVALLLFFAAGLGLTFTPCVLPMLPILSSMVLGRSQIGRGRAMTLALGYVLGMAVTLAIVGALIGSFGAALNLQARLQSPWLLGTFAVFFVLFALAMFGVFELRLPEFVREPLERLNRRAHGGSLPGATAMGALSTLVVSPCISAPLAGALVYISSTGDTLGGGINLFALGLGMGTPLLLITLFGKSLLPGSGPWMETVKHLFGFGLLAVAIWLLERVLPGPVSLALWAALAAGLAVRLAALQSGHYLRQTIALLLGLYAAAALFGALAGGEDPLRPLQPLTGGGNSASSAFFTTVDDPAQLQQALNQAAKQGQPAIVDLYADWCISCKVMERTILNQPEIQTLLGNHLRFKLDVTDNTPAQREWLIRQQLFGPPAYLFFAADGNEQRDLRIQGEVSKDEFAALAERASQK
ncbi:protein-disulfide reductase DsbD [Pseudomonas abyssi]|uniref:Thiol:disulfide interchange protein DsbD n=1 Tax=Pseudomonas abyssi TaxID=170540 RepID=A0A2A3MLT1_9PSED|nr:protein-disulfide reductase DsbD [Pseudomonas abyssi]MAD00153.1 protein-disulfide reductase DsbD [Pseudomonadales bacterium]PBK05504.1 protein-disulfide reductase DsbD [Pseudomonas abyssi]|tara:strand:+ start:9102 stop:10880 length:1779 start_codon:yes stop_codon:yes gene_type:complete